MLLNQGDGTFATISSARAGWFPVHLALYDWNGDGHLDAAAANWSSFTATVLRNRGDGGLEWVANLDSGPYPASVAFTDLDRDARPELLIAGFECNAATVYRWEAGSGWAYSREIGAQWNAYFAAAHDLDGDAWPDVVICSGNGAASVLMNDGSATFDTWHDFPTLAAPIQVAFPDLDQDGRPDILTTHYARRGGHRAVQPRWGRLRARRGIDRRPGAGWLRRGCRRVGNRRRRL